MAGIALHAIAEMEWYHKYAVIATGGGGGSYTLMAW